MIRRKEVEPMNQDDALCKEVEETLRKYEESKKEYKSYPIVEHCILHHKYINAEDLSKEEYDIILEEKLF